MSDKIITFFIIFYTVYFIGIIIHFALVIGRSQHRIDSLTNRKDYFFSENQELHDKITDLIIENDSLRRQMINMQSTTYKFIYPDK